MAKDKQYGSTLTRDEPAAKTMATSPVAPKTVSTRSSVTESTRRDVAAAAAMPFGRQNYILLLAGIGIILAGFFIMSLDKEEFGFGFLGLTLGPIVVMSGFVVEFFAILVKPKA
ncbi:DUF3098 domain-containing protein [Spirosoma endophyticum]|uniref:DUF3098 domain-containing protein n=1 Tax=Spirosoma endophyticum TaxID=662367 RepID=A0A1I1WHP7_9BACT|nr:DUF3098 domain-containing protein [Spirosoma endophyticum]SFD92620.1 Protein of unknown function [Spirosoma endophyticum]